MLILKDNFMNAICFALTPNSQLLSPDSSLVIPHSPCSCLIEILLHALQHYLIISTTLKAHLFPLPAALWLTISPTSQLNLTDISLRASSFIYYILPIFSHPWQDYTFSSSSHHFLQLYFHHIFVIISLTFVFITTLKTTQTAYKSQIITEWPKK